MWLEDILHTSTMKSLYCHYFLLVYIQRKKTLPLSWNILHSRYELAQAQVEQGKMLLAEDDLKKQEEQLRGEKLDAAHYRNVKEQTYADQSEKRRLAQERYNGRYLVKCLWYTSRL